MKIRKDLDQLYQEHLRNAEVKPPMDAWSNIAARLPEKKKKKAFLPLWYKVAGAAALLILLVSLSYTYFSPSPVFSVNPVSADGEKLEDSPAPKEQSPSLQRQKTLPQKQFSGSKSQIASSEDEGIDQPIKKNKIQIENSQPSKEHATEQNSSELGQLAFEDSEPADQELIFTKGDSPKDSGSHSNNTQIPPEAFEITKQEQDPNQIAAMESLTTMEETDDEVTEESLGRLSIGPRAAPVFFDQAGGSGIEGGNGTGSGEASISYGVQVAYRVSKNISIRSGLQILNLNSNVPEIPMDAAVMDGVSKAGTALVLTAPAGGDMELRKDLNFFEVPLEMEYTLIDTKFKLNLIGGGSFLLLDKSAISLNSPYGVRSLQKTEKPDPLSFSTNLGIGLGYELFRELELNLEPMMKFPLGPGSSMGPYYFGIYSGFRYRF